MAVVPVDTTLQVPPPDPVQEPPEVAVTPCDPWPAPYYFEGGLRRVKPYHYTYNTYCKERWRGRELLDIFLSEFRDRPAEYYKKALETGLVCVNGKPGTPHTVVKNGEIISHTLHRHEPPVTGKEIGIIHEDDDLIVIDKPAGVPVHSAGRYHYNSVLEILRSQRHPDWVPRPCNRLDRLTSGVMFLGKHPKAAEMMCEKLKARTLQKEYVARVKGRFPDGVVVCDQPIMSVSPKVGLNRVRATGKEAKTKFRRLAYIPPSAAAAGSGDGDAAGEVGGQARTGVATPPPIYANEEEGYSIVHCLPLTGRTHQIRVHLQFLGHPISNDPIYSNRKVFGPDLGKNETSDERDQELIARLSNLGKTETVAEAAAAGAPGTSTKPDSSENSYRTHLTAAPLVPPGTDASVVEEIMSREHEAAVERYHKRKGERLSGERCSVCDTELYTDPSPEELGIFLHAAAYADKSGPDGWKYTSQMPSWGLPPVGVDGPRAMPDWVDVPEDEEIVIGYGTVPELGGDGDGDDNSKNHAERRGGGIPALVQGVGLVDISAERQAHEAAAAAAAAAASAETGVGAQATA